MKRKHRPNFAWKKVFSREVEITKKNTNTKIIFCLLPVLIRRSGIRATFAATIVVMAPRGGVIINFHLIHHVFDHRFFTSM